MCLIRVFRHLPAVLLAGCLTADARNVVRSRYNFRAGAASVDRDDLTMASTFGNGVGLSDGRASDKTYVYFVRESWTPGRAQDLETAIAADSYVGFTLDNSSGAVIELNQLVFDYWEQDHGSGQMAVFCSLTGFSNGRELRIVDPQPRRTTYRVDLGDPVFTAIPDGAKVEFRFYIWDQTENHLAVHRFDSLRLATLDPVLHLDAASPDRDLDFGNTFSTAPGDFANRTIRFRNGSSRRNIRIQRVAFKGNDGGVFAIVGVENPAGRRVDPATPESPLKLGPGESFAIEVSATSTDSTAGIVSAELFIDTNQDSPVNPQDKIIPAVAGVYPPATPLIDNPTLDAGRWGWTPGARPVSPGPASPGAVRLKGRGDIAGPATIPDTISNSIPIGAKDFEIAFRFAILDRSVVPRYTGNPPSGAYLDRAMQFILLGNGKGTPPANRIDEAFIDRHALINLAYFHDGVGEGGMEGFHLFDGDAGDWIHLTALGTLEGSIDGPDGTPDPSTDAPGTPIAITAASVSSNLATITTSLDHGYRTGHPVTLQGLGFADGNPNGAIMVASIPAANRFTYVLNAPDQTFATGGATARGRPDLGDGILDPDDPKDTVKVYEMRIVGRDFGTGNASYDVSISGANTSVPDASLKALTSRHAIPLTDPRAVPSAMCFTTGDDSLSSGNGVASGINGFNTSWWLDDARVWSSRAPMAGEPAE